MLCTRDIFFRKKCVFCTLFECKHDVARDLHFSLAIVSEIQTHSHSHTNERKKRQESITHRCTHRRKLLALTQTFGEGRKSNGGKNTKCNDTNKIQRNNNGHAMASSNGICCFSFYFSLAVCECVLCYFSLLAVAVAVDTVGAFAYARLHPQYFNRKFFKHFHFLRCAGTCE